MTDHDTKALTQIGSQNEPACLFASVHVFVSLIETGNAYRDASACFTFA
jgi:hypothetical protein